MITATVVGLAQRAGATSLLQPPLFLAAVMIPVVNHLDEWSAAVRRVDRSLRGAAQDDGARHGRPSTSRIGLITNIRQAMTDVAGANQSFADEALRYIRIAADTQRQFMPRRA